MDSKITVNIEADDVNSLCTKLYSELQRYNALRHFVEYSIGLMDEDSLRSIERRIKERRRELGAWLSTWDESSAERFLRKLNPHAKRILELIRQRGRITKSELMRATGFNPMEVAGRIAGMNNMAKKMGKRPVVLREMVRLDGEWDVEYRLEESFSRSMK
jgi:hypothetical protein